MNKKLLFAAMSLAVLTACSTDDIESQKVAQEAGSVQFEFVNNNDATRASMNGTNNNKLVWSARDNDLLTLYHGAAIGATTGYQNATYSIVEGAEGETAKLATPTMILQGGAIMVWPADTTFRIASDGNLSVVIPTEQSDIANQIPFVSDQINIDAYAAYDEELGTNYNTAGWNRTYPIYMRPMASQLNIKADYAGTDATLEELYAGDDPIEEITVESIDLLTNEAGTTKFSTQLPIVFEAANAAWGALPATVHQAWARVTTVNRTAPVAQAAKLTTTFLNGNDGGKFLILPQADIPAAGVDAAAVVVNTYYGKVYVAGNGVGESQYTVAEAADAWYRFVKASTVINPATDNETKATAAETSGDNAGKYKVTADIAHGMKQTINWFSTYPAPASEPQVVGEYEGTKITRYVKVLLNHLDMSGLHIKTDKQLRDVAKVWKKMNLADVTVYLDGNATTGEFEISQTTIAKINEINAATAGKSFKVKPCDVAGEVCNKIVITGGGNVPDLDFIVAGDAANKADVVLKAAQDWSWTTSTVDSKKAVTVAPIATTGINSIINKGTFASSADATIAIYDNAAVPVQVTDIPFLNYGTWSIATGKTINVQFDVTNYGTVTIAAGAQYRQDGAGNDFTNEATDLPERFGGAANAIGLVDNSGVFANINNGHINNYGLIEHRTAAAKTFVTTNQLGGNFGDAFNVGTNKIGRINLTWDNRAEDNVTVNNAATTGFVSVTVDGEVSELGTTAGALGAYVNYIIIKSGVTTISALDAQYEYVEIADRNNTEIAWTTGSTSNYAGLIVLSPVNITYGTNVSATVTYLGADMYVGGTFNKGTTDWDGYYGVTSTNVPTKYITFN